MQNLFLHALVGLRGRGLGVAAAMPSRLRHSALAQDADSCSHDHSEDSEEHLVQTSQNGVGCLNKRIFEFFIVEIETPNSSSEAYPY